MKRAITRHEFQVDEGRFRGEMWVRSADMTLVVAKVRKARQFGDTELLPTLEAMCEELGIDKPI